MIPNFTSSAIEAISDVVDDQVTITFTGGRDYTYGVVDADRFVSTLTETINSDGSVGKFVNNALRENQLTMVTQ